MTPNDIKKLVREIVQQSCQLKDTHTSEKDAPVNYAAVFTQGQEEYETLLAAAKQLGLVIEQTPTGPLFKIKPLETAAGSLQLLKIRMPDKTRPERGDADFTITNYDTFKKKYLGKPGFKLIKRERFEMIEIMDPKFDVRAYFSNPPLDQQLGLDKQQTF